MNICHSLMYAFILHMQNNKVKTDLWAISSGWVFKSGERTKELNSVHLRVGTNLIQVAKIELDLSYPQDI